MDYTQTTEWLFNQVPMFQNLGAGAYKPGLENTLQLAHAWNDPQNKFKSIHIGGTNGKGSTAHTIAAVLQSAGYRTGLYTSPHLVDFRERIRIDGEPVDRQFVVDFVEHFRNNPRLVALRPTFFELTTIMAFSWFARQQVDVAVIEVGLGGRLDCTNIITPLLSVITNISKDHTALLGDTEEAIAAEKAGIIKPGVPVVVGSADKAVRAVFEARAAEVHAPLTFACDKRPFTYAEECDNGIVYYNTPWGDVRGELHGSCQQENAATILTALTTICAEFPQINDDAVKHGFANVCRLTGLTGRWAELATTPVRIICDTGHNIGGWRYLGPSLTKIAQETGLSMVLGFVNDKDINAIVDTMPRQASYYFACPSVSRGRSAELTAAVFAAKGIHGLVCNSVADAFEQAKAATQAGSTVFVGGSTFVVADLLAYLS